MNGEVTVLWTGPTAPDFRIVVRILRILLGEPKSAGTWNRVEIERRISKIVLFYYRHTGTSWNISTVHDCLFLLQRLK